MNLGRNIARPTCDVLIVGGGPAGLACAIASARRGLHVEVVDAMKPPIDKACGEGLMPDTLEALAAIGFTNLDQTLCTTENHRLRGIRFLGDPTSPTHIAIAAEAAFPQNPGRGIRRTVLHQVLLDRAASLGVRFHWENSVQNIAPTADVTLVHSNRQTLRARYLVGADGPRSRIAAWAGLTDDSIQSRRIGLRQHYTIAPWTDFVEVYWSNFGQAYVTPNSSDEVCVAFIANKKFSNAEDALNHFPTLRRHLGAAQPNGPARGSITLGRKLRRVTNRNVALIGDASGSVDAITGEGMALCFRQAAALSLALQADDLAQYQPAHRRIQRLPSLMSRSLLLMDRSPVLRDTVLRTFQRNPWLFARLLQMHIGHSPLEPIGAEGLHVLTG
ncbi:MAG TPA: NAD(P)/FAD-dependent oxidoreductase [Edaphobacter sp.]|nr:NAD(P)/FAD-dependent oxidoreductase [Edaphobacter sp.]